MKRRVVSGLAALFLLFALMTPPAPRASDHADPLNLTDPNANITGLFIFPKDDQYVLIFNVRKSLTNPKPYDLSAYEYVVSVDLTTPVTFDSAEDRARYGGTLPVPDKLHPDVAIKVRLNDDTSLKAIDYTGLKNTDRIRTFTGVRDDPFIFPRFFKKNVISMVMSIPKNAFPDGQQDFILWGTTYVNGKVSDRVGRSVRSQLPRFPILNFYDPKDQIAKLMKAKGFLDDVANFLNTKKEWWSQALAGLLEPVGFAYEIVPGDDPTATARPLRGRMLYNGKPLAGALVEALWRDDPSIRLATHSDAQGAFVFALPRPGVWLIKSVHMVRAGVFASHDWDSLWASLTFEAPKP